MSGLHICCKCDGDLELWNKHNDGLIFCSKCPFESKDYSVMEYHYRACHK